MGMVATIYNGNQNNDAKREYINRKTTRRNCFVRKKKERGNVWKARPAHRLHLHFPVPLVSAVENIAAGYRYLGYTYTLNDGLHVGPGCLAGFIMLEPLH